MAVPPKIDRAVWGEVARHMVKKRWAKPNARHRDGMDRKRRRIMAAQADGDLAVIAVMMSEMLELGTALFGRIRLQDERTSRVFGGDGPLGDAKPSR
jgi:hypothetical protein